MLLVLIEFNFGKIRILLTWFNHPPRSKTLICPHDMVAA